jgi:hypothetical protein
MAVFDNLYDHKIDLARINYGVVTLIPKGDEADRMQKFRPIFLLQVLFKIFTKTLTCPHVKLSFSKEDSLLMGLCFFKKF